MSRRGLTTNRRALSWTTALKSAKQPEQPAVREVRLRMSAGLRDKPHVVMSSWRGVSGRRYVVIVHDLADAASIEAPGAVVLGVRRDDQGLAVLLGAGHFGTVGECAAQAALDGAIELHVHRLAETATERDAMVRDLVDDDID